MDKMWARSGVLATVAIAVAALADRRRPRVVWRPAG